MNINFSEYQLNLYRKCMRKKSKYISRSQYEEEHEYNTESNTNLMERE